MQVRKLDHVNVHTANLASLVEWYGRVLGMRVRPSRPEGRETLETSP